MSTNLAEFSEKFRLSTLMIRKLEYWTWSIRPVHCTLGAGILSLNRFCTNFGAISKDEATELAVIIADIERQLNAAFGPDKFNYLMLMMIDAHLHFHVIPRYGSPREFGDVRWTDGGWPGLPSINDGVQYQDDPVLQQIRDALIELAE